MVNPPARPRSAIWEWAVAAGPVGSVVLSYLFAETTWGNGRWPDRWVLEWGVGGFYALLFLSPLGWLRRLGFQRTVGAIALSVVSWHVAVRFAAEPYGSGGSPHEWAFLGRSVAAGALGAFAVALLPISRGRHWERSLGVVTLTGSLCGGQMALLCLWNFGFGFWLGMLGWQVAVGTLILLGTRDGVRLDEYHCQTEPVGYSNRETLSARISVE